MSRKRKRRRIGSLILGIIELLLAIVIFALIAMAAAYFLCPLKNVDVEGTDLYTKDEIVNYIIDDEYSHNTVYAFIKNKIFPKSDAEFIESFDVVIKGPNSLTIVCNEKSILGYILDEDGKYIYFDYDGKISEKMKKEVMKIIYHLWIIGEDMELMSLENMIMVIMIGWTIKIKMANLPLLIWA